MKTTKKFCRIVGDYNNSVDKKEALIKMAERISAIMLAIAIVGINMPAIAVDAHEDFIYSDKNSGDIIRYTGIDEVCEIPANTVVRGLTAYDTKTYITKLIANEGVVFEQNMSGQIQKFNKLKEVEIREGVTELPDDFLSDCAVLEKVSLPDSLKSIGKNAFSNCPKLAYIELPSGLMSIGENAFCGLTALSGELYIPDSVIDMDSSVFNYCGYIDKVHMPKNLVCKDNVSSYEWFNHTDIGEINIPDSMLKCEKCHFHGSEITFNSDMTTEIYNMVSGSEWCNFKYLKGKTEKSLGSYDGFASVDNTVLRYIGSEKKPIVPNGIKNINKDAFMYCDIDTVTLPQTLEEIGGWAFQLSTIKNIVIPENIKIIGANAFEWCPFLEAVTIEGNPRIGSKSFEITDRLTPDKLMANPDLKNKIISFGVSESDIDGFYALLNDNRAAIGWKTLAKPLSDKATPDPKATSAPKATFDPQSTPDPRATSVPTALPTAKVLEVSNNCELKITVDGKNIEFTDAKPFIDEHNRTQLPVRMIAETVGAAVEWKGDIKTVHISGDDKEISLVIGSDVIRVNSSEVKMDTAAVIVNDRTFVPIRYLAEALGYEVHYGDAV